MLAVIGLQFDVLLFQQFLDLLLLFCHYLLIDLCGLDAFQEARVHILLLIGQQFLH